MAKRSFPHHFLCKNDCLWLRANEATKKYKKNFKASFFIKKILLKNLHHEKLHKGIQFDK